MEVALVVLSIISLSFMIAYVAIVKRLNTVSEGFAKLLMTYNMMLDDVDNKNNFASPEDLDIHKENFIKFLSDSRDWAYDYIENVQSEIKKMQKELGPEVMYYKEYGAASEGMFPPYDKIMKKVSEAYESLEKMLPEESDDRR